MFTRIARALVMSFAYVGYYVIQCFGFYAEIDLNVQEAKKLIEIGFKYETGEYDDVENCSRNIGNHKNFRVSDN